MDGLKHFVGAVFVFFFCNLHPRSQLDEHTLQFSDVTQPHFSPKSPWDFISAYCSIAEDLCVTRILGFG